MSSNQENIVNIKDVFMAGFHYARNFANNDYDDEKCYQQWASLCDCIQPSLLIEKEVLCVAKD